MTDKYEKDGEFVITLRQVLNADESALCRARSSYGESWCKRGGVGAFMMLARKWDRLENYLSKPPIVCQGHAQIDGYAPAFLQWDILGAIAADKRPEGIIDDIRDLRRYLELVEAKAIEMGICPGMLAKDSVKIDSDIKPVTEQIKNTVEFLRRNGLCEDAQSTPRKVASSPALGAPHANDPGEDQPTASQLHPHKDDANA
jgi:hypothetical protein